MQRLEHLTHLELLDQLSQVTEEYLAIQDAPDEKFADCKRLINGVLDEIKARQRLAEKLTKVTGLS